MDFFEKTLSEKEIFSGKIIRVHLDEIELPNGDKSFREVVEHSGGVCVVPFTEEGNIILVKQFRYPYKKELLELPAGKLEKGEDPLEAAMRELEEECGFVSDTVIPLGNIYPTVAYCSEIIYMYCATNLTKTAQHLDDGEFLSVHEISLDKAEEMVMSGEICDAKTVAGVLKVAKLKRDGVI